MISNFIKNASIRKKLIWLSMTTCGLALLSACFFFILYESKLSKNTLQNEVLLLSKVIARNSIAAIEFEDKALAYETLSSLAMDSRISSAAIYNDSGKLFVSYSKKENNTLNFPEKPDKEEITITNNRMNIFYPIEFKRKRIGTLYIQASLKQLSERLNEYLLISFGVLLFSLVIGVYLSSKLQKLITVPIEKLKRVALESQQISNLKNLDELESEDEIGDFAEAFKNMLLKLKKAEEELKSDSDKLELLVKTRTKELEIEKINAEKANQAKTEFLSQMSHELRTPLNAILGFAQLLELDKENKLSPIQNNNITTIIKSGEHLLFLINEILDLAKVESGQLDLHIEPISVSQVLNETCLMLKPLADSSGINFIYPEEFDNTDLFISGDLVRVKQVLTNILSNAIKYNKSQGRVILEVQPTREEVIFIASDTGPGIPEDQHKKIFEPFYRMKNHHHKIEGTGIGLPISKKLVESMGGKILLESKQNVGSKFSIKFLKCDLITKKETLPQHQIDDNFIAASSKNHSILYIEDDLANTDLVRKILKRNTNISFTSATSAQEGIEMAKELAPDIILMDIQMPDIDGLTAFKILRDSEKTKLIPVIAISANAMEDNIQKTINLGFHSYITKPIRVSLFLETINKILNTIK